MTFLPKRKNRDRREFVQPSRVSVIGSIVRRIEELTRQYSQEPEQLALMKRSIGIVDTCAMINARACTSVPIRLYRKTGRGGVSRSATTRRVPTTRRKSLASGQMGIKAQMMMDSMGDVEEIMEGEVLDFVRKPNPYYGEMFHLARFYFAEITGEFYSIVTDDDMGKLQWPGLPQFTRPIFARDGQGPFLGVSFGRESSDVIDVPADSVIYYRMRMARNNPNRGEGVLTSQLPDVDTMIKTQLAALAFVEQGNRPDSMITVDADTPLTSDQIGAIYDNLDEWRLDGAKFGKPFIGQKLRWEPLGFTPKDLRTPEQMDRIEKRIWQAFGIPESIMAGNASTFASALVSDAQYGRLTVLPRLVIDADQKTDLILPMFGMDPDEYCFVYDNPVPRDEQAEATMRQGLFQSAMLTINEARQEMGYDKSDDEFADRLLYMGQPLGQQPASADPFAGLFSRPRPEPESPEPEAQPDPEPEQPNNPPEPDDEPDTRSAKPDRSAIVKHAMGSEHHRWAASCDCCGGGARVKKDDPPPPGVLGDIETRYEAGFAERLREILRSTQNTMIDSYGRGEIPDSSALRGELEETLRGEIERAASDAIEAELRAARAGDDLFGVVDERARRFAQDYTIRLTDDILGTTADIASAAVERGLSEGLSVRDVADAMDGVPEYRAEMIARTELSRAANGARYEQMGELGAERVEWVLSPGACPLCRALAAKGSRPVGSEFGRAGETLGGVTLKETVYFPPAHPNDRCVVIADYPEAE